MNSYCINCGKYGHNTKLCIEPIISCGIICFNIKNISLKKIEQYLFNKYINIDDYSYKNINYINKIDFHNNDIKFVLIERKHSLSYIEFIRGKYDENDLTKIESMFSLMSKTEVNNIKTESFDILWNNLWNDTANSKTFLKEKNVSKTKFNNLLKNSVFNNLSTTYESPEWGFPKGRRNKHETNIDCANREFIEESNITNYTLFDRIECVEETFKGTNNKDYKHIYYLSGTELNELSTFNYTYEVNNVKWCTIDEVLNLFRPYEKTKIEIINQIYFFLSILSDKIKKQNNVIYSLGTQ
jgi:8-oxo-dGTP pyrophosphatase MutT (NUDIX family)